MTSWQIILVLGGIPVAVMILLGLLTVGPSLRRTPRYEPGQEWNHPPVWWTAAASISRHQGTDEHPAGADGEHGGARGNW
ncbi:MAG TPA: hypothetical protein VGI84_08515 [Pseudonocardiaceae bacterium]